MRISTESDWTPPRALARRRVREVMRVWIASGCIVALACGRSDLLPTAPDEQRSPTGAVQERDRGDDSSPTGLAILVDASRDGGVWWFPQPGQVGGYDPGLHHQGKALADHLRSLGYRVDELPRPYTITRALLDSYDIVIRASAFSGYAPDEVSAYAKYVEQGGRLLLLNDHMRYAAPDAVGAAFGIVFAGITRGVQLLDSLDRHPIARDAGQLVYGVGSAIVEAPESAVIVGRLTSRGYADLDFDEAESPGDIVAPAVLGAMKRGHGRVVFSGDTNMWEQVPRPLVDNVLEWLERS